MQQFLPFTSEDVCCGIFSLDHALSMDNVCNRHLFSIPSRVERAEEQQHSLKMASAHVVETSVTNNNPSQDSNHPDDLSQPRYATPGFKPFS